MKLGLILLTLLFGSNAHAQWAGFEDRSAERGVDRYDFGSAGGSNENYYDGDMGDFDGDGRIDRAVISRFGLLYNAGGGVMLPVSTQRNGTVAPNSGPSLTGYLFGDEVRIGNDAVQFVDLDGDGDLDVIQGGNGEPLVVQTNLGGRFAVTERLSGSAVQIVNTDLERDGDVDVIVSCWFPSGPDDFSVFVNDGTGALTDQAGSRGADLRGNEIVGVASGDVDRDGDFDIVTVSRGANQVWTLLNDGAGRFTRREVDIPGGRIRSTSGFAQGTQLGDIDDDGDLDLLVLTNDYIGSHDRVGHLIFINDGSGNFTEESAARFDVEGGFIGKLLGANGKLVDVDYDGDLDIVAFTDLAGPPLNFQLYLNDGTGRFRYTVDRSPAFGGARPDSVGADVDVADLDHDGTYDLWVGIGGGQVTQLHNTWSDPTGVPADVPRNVQVTGVDAGGPRIRWDAPPFAANARHYVIYRSLAPAREARDRPLVHRVAISAFEDEGFATPLTRFTTAAELGDPDVTIDGTSLEWIDREATPGVEYFYSVAHVGPENARSQPSREVSARAPASGADTSGPEIEIASPSTENWMAAPRIAIHFGDASGVDADSLSLVLDRDLAGAPAGTNLVERAVSRTASSIVVWLDEALPLGATELTFSARDSLGNESSATRRFGVSVTPRGAGPALSIAADRMGGEVPLTVRFDADTSASGGGEVLRVEWVFGDGTTGIGREIEHRFDREGAFEVWARAIDDTGAVALAQTMVEVQACTTDCVSPDAGGLSDGGGLGDAGPGADSGEDRIPVRPGSGGGCSVSSTSASWCFALFLLRRKRHT